MVSSDPPPSFPLLFLRFFPTGFSFFRLLVYKPFNAAIYLYLVRVRSSNIFVFFGFQLHLTYIANVTAGVDFVLLHLRLLLP